jgi:hypothetical protein
MDPTCQQDTVQAGGGSILVWGVFTWLQLGPLVHLNASLTGDRYVTLLDDHLQLFMNVMTPTTMGNAPCNRAGVVQYLFEEHSGEFRRMVWPPRSPDMNPIKHLWDVVERTIRTHNPAPTNTRELWAAIQTAWLNVSPEVFRPLVESMPRRVAALCRARRGHTRY